MRFPRRALALAAAAAAACARGEDGGAPHPLRVEPEFLELGSVPFGEKTEAAWRFQNLGARPLEIVRIGPLGCQCAGAELVLASGRGVDVGDGMPISAVIGPGERAELRLRLDTSRYREPVSRKVGSVPVLFAGAEPLVLQWAVDVWTPFAVEPWDLDLGEVGVRQRAQGRVLVQAHDEDDFGLELDLEEDGWRVRSRRLSPPGAKALWEIVVTAPPELPEGGFQRGFRFLTDLAGAPPVRFAVRGVAGPDLVASPRRVLLDPARGVASARIEMRHRAAGGVVRELGFGELPAGLEIVDADAAPAATRGFTLRWNAAPPAGAVRGILVVRTGDAERPEVGVPWTVLPADARSP